MTLKQTATFATLFFIGLMPLTASAQSFTYSGGIGGTIPDDEVTSISSTISVGDNFALTDFTSVTITGLNHTFLGDLTITLSHGGTTVDIIDRVRGNGNNVFGDDSRLSGDYTFVTTGGADFNAAAAATDTDRIVFNGIPYATVPVGNTNPEGGVSSANGLLSDFVGQTVSGAWTLNIFDRDGGFTGVFTGWRFSVERSSFINRSRTISDNLYSAFPTVTVGNTTSADVTLAAGATVQNVRTLNNSRLFMNGGTAASLRAEDTAKLYINAGTISGAITATENSTAFVSGGTVGSVVTEGNANAYVLAGTFGSVSASGTSDIFVYGGGSGGAVFGAYGGASISLFGDNLALDRANAMRGTDAGGIMGTFYNLSGTLTDGASLAGTRFFDADGGLSIVGENSGALFFNGVAVVPEPGTLPLFALAGVGALGIVARRRKC